MSTLVFDRDEVRRHVGAPSERLDAPNLAALAEIERRWGVDFSDRDIGLFHGRENLVQTSKASTSPSSTPIPCCTIAPPPKRTCGASFA